MADSLAVEAQYPDLFQNLMTKLRTLSSLAWGGECEWGVVRSWLQGFTGRTGLDEALEQLHALHLLSSFIYFGTPEVRELLRSLYRDVFRYEIVSRIRYQNSKTTDSNLISRLYKGELAATRFLPLGNPSESSSHLLYYFRQVNNLPRSSFAHVHEAIELTRSSSGTVKNCVFIDDFTATGEQALEYSRNVVQQLRAYDKSVAVKYYVMLATTRALSALRGKSEFTDIKCVLEISDDFKAFDATSLFYVGAPNEISPAHMRRIAQKYGQTLAPGHPLGYGDSELLLGFSHNIPDNTLPIFCFSSAMKSWQSPFPRIPKYDGPLQDMSQGDLHDGHTIY